MSDHTDTLTLQSLPRPAASASERFASLLQSKTATGVAVVSMWALATADWLSIHAGNAPNRKIFITIVAMATVLAVGRIRLAFADKPR
jgi:hypothetical protein